MTFMELQITRKGTLAAADCDKCGMTLAAHEWADYDFNEARNALQNGTYRCPECGGRADADTFYESCHMYAGRYHAAGYMDCSDWSYSANKRRLAQELRQLYGD